jgi:exonuclease SbcC
MQLQDAEAHIEAEETALASARRMVEDAGLRLQDARTEYAEVIERLRGKPLLQALVRSLQEQEERVRKLQQQHGSTSQALGAVRQKIEDCIQLQHQHRSLSARLVELDRERNVYRTLVEAFGKNGIQALLIEAALPEIEEEANQLLGRMTDNRLSVKLESQRETRSGQLRETLDIKINDEFGIRSYELFSGGEAFRVNFSLRVALSKVLARRAGASVPTLFIDEGFGTQDAVGRERLVQAISAIQDDFERILVITHVEELKEAFPVRIEVTKTAAGSTFAVV